MATIAELSVAITAETSGLVRGLGEADRNVSSFGEKVRTLGSSLSSFGGALTLATAPLSLMAGFALKTGVAFDSMKQQALIAFTTMLGGADQAKAMLEDLTNFAATTPFTLTGLIPLTQQLIAFGFEGREVIPMLTGIGDAIAGLGRGEPEMQRMILNLGQIKAAGHVTGREIRDMSTLGINALQILADSFGKTTGEMQQMISKGLIPADEGIKAIVDGLEKGTKNTIAFGGMMAAQSKTLVGIMSNLKDTADKTFGAIFQPLVDKGTPILQNIQTKLADFGQAVEKIGLLGALSGFTGLSENFFKIAGAIGAVLLVAGPLTLGLGLLLSAIGALLSPIGLMVLAITALAAAYAANLGGIRDAVNEFGADMATFWAEHGEAIKTITANAWEIIKETISGALQIIATSIKVAGGILSGDWGQAMGALVSATRKATRTIADDLNDMWQGYKQMFNAADDAQFQAGKKRFLTGEGRPVIPSIVSKAEGPQTRAGDWSKILDADGLRLAMAEFDGTLDIGIKKIGAKVHGAKAAGGSVSKALVDGFKEGSAGLADALAVIGSKSSAELAALFDPMSKGARKNAAETVAALKVAAPAIDEMLKQMGYSIKVTTAELIGMPEGLRIALGQHALAVKKVNEDINQSNLEGVAKNKSVMLIWADDYAKLKAVTVKFANDHNVIIKTIPKGVAFAEDEIKQVVTSWEEDFTQLGISMDKWAAQTRADFERVSADAPRPAEAIEIMAGRIKKAISESAQLIQAKAAIEINEAGRSIVDTFIRIGEQTKLTGEALIRFVRDQISQLPPALRDIAGKSLKDFLAEMYKLPGALDEIFNKLASGAKQKLSGLFEVINSIPGKFGDALRKSTNEVTKWVDQIDGILKGLHKIFKSVPDGLGGLLEAIIGVFKHTQQATKSSIDLVTAGLEDIFGPMVKKVGPKAAEAGVAIGKGVSSGIGDFLSSAAGITAAISGALALSISTFQSDSKYKRFLGSFALGGPIGGILAVIFGGPSELQKAQMAAQIQAARDAIKISAETVLQAVQTTIQATVESFTKALDFFDKLDEFTAPRKEQFRVFFKSFSRMMDYFFELALQWSTESMTKAKGFAESIGPIVTVVGGAVLSLDALAKFGGVPEKAITKFANDLALTLGNFIAVMETFEDMQLVTQAKKFANRITSIISVVGEAVTSLSAIAKFGGVSESAMVKFANDLALTLGHFIAVMETFENKDLVIQAKKFAGQITGVVGVVGQAVTSLSSLATFGGVAEGTIVRFATDLALALKHFIAVMETVASEQLTKAAALTESIGPILTTIGTAIENFSKLGSFEIAPESKFVALAQAMKQGVQAFMNSLTDISQSLLNVASDKAGPVKNILDAIGSIATAAQAIANFPTFDFNKIESSTELARRGVDAFIKSMEGIDQGAVQKAVEFAGHVRVIADTLKAWTEATVAVKANTLIAAETWDAIVANFMKAIQLMGVLIDQATLFESMAITLEDKLKSGAQHLADGVAAMAAGILGTASALQGAFGHIQGGEVGAMSMPFGMGAMSTGNGSATPPVVNDYSFTWNGDVVSTDPETNEQVRRLVETVRGFKRITSQNG